MLRGFFIFDVANEVLHKILKVTVTNTVGTYAALPSAALADGQNCHPEQVLGTCVITYQSMFNCLIL